MTLLLVILPVTNNVYAEVQQETLPSYYCLRDEFYINTSNQLDYNTCWIFSSTKCLETTLAKSTNEYYDLSEAYLTLVDKCKLNKTLGSAGGTLADYYNLIKEYGIVSEKDFPFDELSYIGNANYIDRYNYYKEFADKKTPEQVKWVNYDYSNKEAIKRHIKEHGAVNINDSKRAHAMTAIGWDDSQSAFIVLDSRGGDYSTDGIIYVSYSYSYIQRCYGFKYVGQDDVKINNNSEYKIKIAEKHKNQLNATPVQKNCLQKNIFYYKKSQSLDYVSSLNITKVALVEGKCERAIEFTQSSNNIKLTLNDENNLNGVYKIKFEYENNGVSDCEYKYVYFVGDVEFESISFSSRKDLGLNKYYVNINAYDETILVNSKIIDFTSYPFEIKLVLNAYSDCSIQTSSGLNYSINGKVVTLNPNEVSSGKYSYDLKLYNSEYERVYKIEYVIADNICIANVLTDSLNQNLERFMYVQVEENVLIDHGAQELAIVQNEELKKLTKELDSFVINYTDIYFSEIKNAFTQNYCDQNYKHSFILKELYKAPVQDPIDEPSEPQAKPETEIEIEPQTKPEIKIEIVDKNQNILTKIRYGDQLRIEVLNKDIQVNSIRYFINEKEIDLTNYNFNIGENSIDVIVNYSYNGETFEEKITKNFIVQKEENNNTTMLLIVIISAAFVVVVSLFLISTFTNKKKKKN